MEVKEIVGSFVTIRLSADECALLDKALDVAVDHVCTTPEIPIYNLMWAMHGAFQALTTGAMLQSNMTGNPQNAYEAELDLAEMGIKVSLVHDNQRRLLKPSSRYQTPEPVDRAAD